MVASDDAPGTTASVAAVSSVKIGETETSNAAHSAGGVISPSAGLTPSGWSSNFHPAVTAN